MATKNLTVSLNKQEHDDLNYLVEYFQGQSISTVTKSDVFKFLIRQMKKTLENDLLEEVTELIEENENNNDNNNNGNSADGETGGVHSDSNS